MNKLAIEVAEFIGRCNLYQERATGEKWFNEDGLFCQTNKELIDYIKSLNQNFKNK
jgi:hypothetical protein